MRVWTTDLRGQLQSAASDGLVRGNGKIVQELEGVFRRRRLECAEGALGRLGCPVRARLQGMLRKIMMETVDGTRYQGQGRQLHPGAILRQDLNSRDGPSQHVRQRHLASEPRRHDPHKGLRRLLRRHHHEGQPTVILAKTVKGYGMGKAGEAQNITHQQKKMDLIRSGPS